MFTVKEHLGRSSDFKIVYFGDGNNVVHSWLDMARRMSFHFVCSCPEGFEPDEDVVQAARQKGLSRIEISHDPQSAVKGANVVYTDVWASMGKKDQIRDRMPLFEGFRVDKKMMSAASNNALFMHCLPAERGRETTDEVIESPASIVFDQAENRMHVQNAIMVKLGLWSRWPINFARMVSGS